MRLAITWCWLMKETDGSMEQPGRSHDRLVGRVSGRADRATSAWIPPPSTKHCQPQAHAPGRNFSQASVSRRERFIVHSRLGDE